MSTPAAIPLTRTPSTLSTETVVPRLGVLHQSIHELCEFIQRQRSLQQAIITMTEGYAERLGAIVHRFLVLELKREDKKPIYLRLDRRLGKGVPTISLLRTSGVTSANDTVGSVITVLWRNCSQDLNVKAQFASSKDRLLKGAERENQQAFKEPLALDKMRHILLVTCDELRTYKLWPVSS